MRLFYSQKPTKYVVIASALICMPKLPTAVCLPGRRSDTQEIPSCALTCVENFISREYPSHSCSGLEDIDCLCRTNTTSGLTLGEGALSCSISFCPSSIVATSNVYAICNRVAGALPETHSTITATILATVPASFTATSSTRISTSHIVHSTTSISRTTRATSASSPRSTISSLSSFLLSTTLSTSSQSTSFIPPSPSNTQPATSLNTPAVVGVSIASGVSAVFLVGVLLFFCARRIRRKKIEAEDKETFEIGGSMSEPPNFTASSPRNVPPGPSQPPGNQGSGSNFHNFPLEPVSRGGPLVVVPQPPAGTVPVREEAIGIAISPETDYEASPQSHSSQRTVSQLLPDKPNYAMYPSPLRVSRQDPRPISGGTVFEEDIKRPRSSFGPPLERAPYQPTQEKDVFGHQLQAKARGPYPGLPSDPRALMYAAERTRNQRPNIAYPVQLERPVYARQEEEAQSAVRQNLSSGGNSRWSLRRSLSRTGGRRSFKRPSNSRNSETSDTSFESIDMEEDDETFAFWNPALPKQLSPVRENLSPFDDGSALGLAVPYVIGNSPVKYPRVPRSASISRDAEVIPAPRAAKIYEKQMNLRGIPDNDASTASFEDRSPEQRVSQIPLFLVDSSSRSRSSSPTSNPPAKRCSDTVADKMETESRSENQQDLTAKYDREQPPWKIVTNASLPKTPPGRNTQRESPGSPREHNITPSRRGADLYLSVD